jgi:hypothetical protein
MVPLMSLWMPILLSAVMVFVASSVIHMILTYHRSDYGKLSAEDAVMEALRKYRIPPGDYMVPCATGPKSMKDPGFLEKIKKGPVIIMTVMKSGSFGMGGQLAQWFLYCVVVSVFSGYVAGRALPTGTDYISVFRFTGTVAFVGYALALWQNTIWYKKAWTTTLKSTVDGLVYGLLTGGVFGWLWPL